MVKWLIPISKCLKRGIVRIIMLVLARGMVAGSKLDSRIKEETEQWHNGFSFMLKSDPFDKGVCLTWSYGKLKYSFKTTNEQRADIIICFKNVEAAFLVFTGQLGIAKAFTEHRFTVKGDIFQGIPIVRCMNIVESYLFPRFISKRILKRIPDKETSSLRIYSSVFLGI